MPPRYFIGLTLPKDMSKQISGVQYKLYDEKLLLKPLIPHITIIHPNALAKISPLWLVPKLKEIQKQLMPIDITIGPIATFNNANLHLKAFCPELNGLYEETINLLPKEVKSAHFVGKRPFDPHITIAQAKPLKSLSPKHINLYSQDLKSLVGRQFKVNGLTKFEHTAPRQYQIKQL